MKVEQPFAATWNVSNLLLLAISIQATELFTIASGSRCNEDRSLWRAMELVANYVDFSAHNAFAAVLRWCDTAGAFILNRVNATHLDSGIRG